jgi:glycosyltransferase involved in cell wall biosynthesis
MRIGIDARNDGTGVGRYTFSLIRELARIDSENEYVLFLRRRRLADYAPPAANFRTVEAEIPWFTLREQLLLPRLVARQRLDLVHYPNVTVPLLATTPFVVTVHDLNYLDAASIFSERSLHSKLLAAGYRLELEKVRHARRLIAVSEHTREALLSALRVDSRNVAVTYEAADFPGELEADRTVLERHELTRPFFLYVGAAYPYKNLSRLIDAFGLFLGRVDSEFDLVLAGDHEQFAPSLRERARSRGIENRVVFPGRVSEPELVALYEAALAYVFVSLGEGFGLPGLEAMTAGVPVIAAQAGSLPEIYRDAAVYCDATTVESIATTLAEVASDDALRTRLTALGRQRAGEFSWARTAEQTLAVYRSALYTGPRWRRPAT